MFELNHDTPGGSWGTGSPTLVLSLHKQWNPSFYYAPGCLILAHLYKSNSWVETI